MKKVNEKWCDKRIDGKRNVERYISISTIALALMASYDNLVMATDGLFETKMDLNCRKTIPEPAPSMTGFELIRIANY